MLLGSKQFTPGRHAPDIVTLVGEVGTNTYTYTFDDDTKGQLILVHVTYTSDATAGNRQLRLTILDADDNVFWDSHAGAVQAASLVRHYAFMSGIYRETSFVDGEIQVSIPTGSYIPPGYKLKVHDETGVSASDAMSISIQYDSVM